jgi:hypothetical protein
MDDFADVGGEFWASENPDVRARGVLTKTEGRKFKAALDRGLTGPPAPDPRPRPAFVPGDMAGAVLAHAAASLARFRAIDIRGQLDNGELVTLLAANNHGGSSGPPAYVTSAVVFGALVSSDQLYGTARFRLDDPYWLAHLDDEVSSVVNDDSSILRVEASQHGNWLVYESSAPATLRQLEIRVISSCLALAQLALYPDEDLVTSQTELRIGPQGDWLPVWGSAFREESNGIQIDTLLPRTELTVERFARWIELNDRFDGLAWALARDMNDFSIQAQVQSLTSLVEGFHRRLTGSFEQSWFTGVSKAAMKRIRDAAAAAGADQAEKEGLNRDLTLDRMDKALGHVGDKSYLERAEEIVTKVCAAVPEIAESVERLAARLTEPRHSFAHQLPQDDNKDPLDDRIRRWMVVSKVAPWLLRALLLLEIGVEPRLLRERYLEFQRFAFHRINVEQRVIELGWELPPLVAAPSKDT